MNDVTQIVDLGPRRVGKYTLRGRLGAGAMGEVHEAHDPDIDRAVAIKTIHRHLVAAQGGEDWLARFSREARAAGRVLHPNLVTIFDYLEEGGLPYLVMERLEARTLETRLSEPTGLQLAEVGAIMSQILDGLSAIHAADIVHRDLKPANVMLTRTGGVKLTDFGIARFTQSDRTGAGMIGTPAYMAPEQFSGESVDARADIYAVGCVLYEVLTGQTPYKGGGIEAVMRAEKGDPVDVPSACVPGLPAALDDLVMRAISPHADQRPATAREMRDALLAALDTGAVATTQPRLNAPSQTANGTMITKLSGDTLKGLEQSLVARIGPIGKLLTRRAAQTAVSQEDLMSQILSEVGEGQERDDLERALSGHLKSEPAPSTFAKEDLAAIVSLLIRYIGPIATTLVRREAAQANDIPQLITTLSTHIDKPDNRARFLTAAQAQFPKGASQ